MIRLLRALAWRILARFPMSVEDRAYAWHVIDGLPDVEEDRLHAWRLLAERRPLMDEIDTAILGGFHDAGVAEANFYPEYQLGPKFHEVLLHSARRLGNPMSTVQHVKDLLR